MAYFPNENRTETYAIFAYVSRLFTLAPVAKTIANERDRLASLLRQLRNEKGIRQVDLAEKLKQPQSYVSRFESGEQRVDLIELRAICLALETDLPELVRRFEQES